MHHAALNLRFNIESDPQAVNPFKYAAFVLFDRPDSLDALIGKTIFHFYLKPIGGFEGIVEILEISFDYLACAVEKYLALLDIGNFFSC
jgi:hypothetical protein